MVPTAWAENSKNEVKHSGANKSSTSELWVSEWTSQKAPRRHPEGIFLMNHHHSRTKCKNFPGLIILLCVFVGPSGIHWYLQWNSHSQRRRGHGSLKSPLPTPKEPLQLKTVWGKCENWKTYVNQHALHIFCLLWDEPARSRAKPPGSGPSYYENWFVWQ